jgi:hypothetical protein
LWERNRDLPYQIQRQSTQNQLMIGSKHKFLFTLTFFYQISIT